MHTGGSPPFNKKECSPRVLHWRARGSGDRPACGAQSCRWPGSSWRRCTWTPPHSCSRSPSARQLRKTLSHNSRTHSNKKPLTALTVKGAALTVMGQFPYGCSGGCVVMGQYPYGCSGSCVVMGQYLYGGSESCVVMRHHLYGCSGG